MYKIEIQKENIINLETDAIVNAANSGLQAGGGVCGAIFQAAGYEKLQEACDAIGHCDTGSAVITPGFDLKAKYVIHAVGPIYRDGQHKERESLYLAYRNSLELALSNGCRSIGFPLISAGIYGYPVEEAWDVALEACMDFVMVKADHSMEIIFAVLDDRILKIGAKALDKAHEKLKMGAE